MQGRHQRSYAERVPLSPFKKVTFYGPVMTTKSDRLQNVEPYPHVQQQCEPLHLGESLIQRKSDRLQNVENQAVSSRRTLFSSSRTSKVNQDADLRIPRSHLNRMRSSSNEERPHSKAPVIGRQIKTRLTCNHTKPKCEACIAHKKKSIKQKHQSPFSNSPKQSHVLPSTRSLPRGGVDGRKLYGQDNLDENSLSVIDANWKPDQRINAESLKKRSGNGVSLNKDSSTVSVPEDSVKKRVQFAEKGSSRGKEQHSNCHKDHNGDNYISIADKIHSTRRKENSSLHLDESGKRSNPARNNDFVKESDNGSFHLHGRNPYASFTDDVYNSTSSSDQDLRPRPKDDFCRLCESVRSRCMKHLEKSQSSVAPKHQSRPHHLYRPRTHSLPASSSSTDEEHCLLCQRYGKNHYYIDDSDCCYLCEIPRERRRMKSAFLHAPHPHTKLPPPPPPPLAQSHHSRPGLHRQWSTPMFISDGEEDAVFKKIPYEPKTDMVKDLKKKIEDEYLHKEYLRKKRNSHRRWRSWDAEDLGELRRFRNHRCKGAWEYVPQHKCVHHYLQNNRLFLEPTLTNCEGSSLCSECGAPKPKDQEKDPYLYHITLGGLQSKDRLEKENALRQQCKDNLSKYKNQHVSHLMGKSMPRLPGDSPKHIFARLNRDVDHIFPATSHYELRPHLADKLRYRVNPHTKRHPSKSMALVDHLL